MTGAVRGDRSTLLAAIDLDQLLEDLAQERGLRRRGRQFPCPSLEHEQSGRTPPASTAIVAGGYGVWHCHGCGAGGTAVDALIAAGRARDPGDAFRELGADSYRASARRLDGANRPAPAAVPDAERLEQSRRVLGEYVTECVDGLYTPAGEEAREWLLARGLTESELSTHRLGFDPGCRVVSRASHRLPAPIGPAISVPILNARGEAIYVQARQLATGARAKYLNPCSAWLGPSPRMAMMTATDATDPSVLVVTEGIFDAIIARRCFSACAVLGVGQPDKRLASELVQTAAGRHIGVCFDADTAGTAGGGRLVRLLRSAGAVRAGSIDLDHGDLNDLLLRDLDRFESTLRTLVRRSLDRRSVSIEL